MLPRVLLEKGASVDGCGVVDLDLLVAGRALERIRTKERGEPLSKGITAPPFLVDLGLAEPFLPDAERFVIFTFFSNLEGNHQHANTTLHPPHPTQGWRTDLAS